MKNVTPTAPVAVPDTARKRSVFGRLAVPQGKSRTIIGAGHIVMGPVERAVRNNVHEGDVLYTPSTPKPFWVGRTTSEGIVLELGQKLTPTFFTWSCLEGVPAFLRRYDDVKINGSGKNVSIVPGTLDGYLKEHINRLTAGWVAVLLERAGVVDIQRTTPSRVRLSVRFQ